MEIEAPPTEHGSDKPMGKRRGLVLVHTGDGKGKSTAAFGLALRADVALRVLLGGQGVDVMNEYNFHEFLRILV